MKKVLIIEDDHTLLEGLQIFLEMEGFRALTATNGLDGIRLAKIHHPDIILTNYQMPGADGLELIRAVREDPSVAETPMIFITANHRLAVRDQAMAVGADAFLRKPFSTSELMEKVDGLLQPAHAH